MLDLFFPSRWVLEALIREEIFILIEALEPESQVLILEEAMDMPLSLLRMKLEQPESYNRYKELRDAR